MGTEKLRQEMLASTNKYASFAETEAESLETFITALNTDEVPRRIQEARDELEQHLITENQKAKAGKDQDMLKLFQKAAGMEIRITSAGGMKIVFINLDSADTDRIFFVIVDLVDDKVWNIYDCNPHVSGLRTLIEELNSTNNLSIFCKQIRGKFKDLISNK